MTLHSASFYTTGVWGNDFDYIRSETDEKRDAHIPLDLKRFKSFWLQIAIRESQNTNILKCKYYATVQVNCYIADVADVSVTNVVIFLCDRRES